MTFQTETGVKDMRRGTRQRLDGDGWDWVSKSWRRALVGFQRAGVGKAIKRRMAKRLRRTQQAEDRRERQAS